MDNSSNQDQQPNWERQLLEKVALAAINEQKTARRWGIFFKMMTFAYLAVVMAVTLFPKVETEISSDKQHVAVIDVQGMIAEDEAASADSIIEGLRDAAKDKNTKGIVLNINSPGGSAVQAAYVYDEIRRQKQAHPDLPIYSVVGDICASGGYYIAAASDKIFVSPASIIGSIGVVMNGFGFTQVLDKLGVERRLLTAGEHKAMLDPFSPVKPGENQHMQGMLDEVHQQFIAAVRRGRGDRLQETPDMFSGLVWSGESGVKLGLADAFGSVDSVAREQLGSEETVDFTPREHLLDRLAGKFATSFGHAFAAAISELRFN